MFAWLVSRASTEPRLWQILRRSLQSQWRSRRWLRLQGQL